MAHLKDTIDLSVRPTEKSQQNRQHLFTGAQPKAGTSHKMQSVSVVFSMLHCEGYIADLRYHWLITSGSARWLIEILTAILESTRHGGQSTERL